MDCRAVFVYCGSLCILSHVYPGFYRNTVYEISFSQKYMELYSSNTGIFGKRRNTGNSCSSKNTEMSRPYQTMCCIFVLLLLYALVLMFLQMFYTVERAAGRGYQCIDVQCIWAFAESG